MMTRVYRWRKRLLLPFAALPICQVTGGCEQVVASTALELTMSTVGMFVSSIHQVLLQNFPSADILQVLLGGAAPPPLIGG